MRFVLVLFALMGLAACDTANDVADTFAREQAKTVVNGVVEQRFPGVNAAPVTDCIIDAASAGEILSIARASVTEVTDATVQTVLEIAQRPEALNCIVENSLAPLGS